MLVTDVGWGAAGSPTMSGRATGGNCSRCSARPAAIRAKDAVSKQFTGFDSWRSPAGSGLCHPCAWSYLTPTLRTTVHLVLRDPAALHPLTKPETADVLAGGELSASAAIIVPLRPGRRHLMPEAQWGRVSTEDGALSWSSGDAHLLRTVLELRRLGFGSRMLAEAAPPYPVLQRVDRDLWPHIFTAWDLLSSWRRPDHPWLRLALSITLSTKTVQEIP